MNDDNFNFNLICRTCLSIKSELQPLFENNVLNMLNSCQFLQVPQNDNFPKYICISCRDIVIQSYNFKKQCEKSQLILEQCISQGFHSLKEFINVDNPWTKLEQVGTFKCNSCPKVCADENDLRTHENSHIKNKHSNCVGYNKKAANTLFLKKQVKVHTEKKRRKCSNLDRLFSDNDFDEQISTNADIKENTNQNDLPENLTAFLEEDSPPPLPFQCPDCSQSFNAEYDLQLHRSTHSKNGEYICTNCKKQFATRQMLKRHIKTHMLNKPHICKECGKGFAESHALTKHIRRHTGQPREKKHLCTVCGQGFSEPFYLNVHMRKHTGERPLMCSACGKSFADPRSLKAHNMTHTGERPYKCHLCNKAFSQSVNLTKHIRIHTGEKPYVCSECGKCFTQSSSLDKHSRTHTGERPYACEHCPKRFAEKGTLIHHNRTHTGEKPYICESCGRSFASSSELKLHNRKHTGIKKNVCHVCGKDFATPSNLLVHSRTHSGEKPFPCTICGRPFADKGSLRKHSKIHTEKSKNMDQCHNQTFVNLPGHLTGQNLDNLHNVIERTVDISLNERLYFNLT